MLFEAGLNSPEIAPSEVPIWLECYETNPEMHEQAYFWQMGDVVSWYHPCPDCSRRMETWWKGLMAEA